MEEKSNREQFVERLMHRGFNRELSESIADDVASLGGADSFTKPEPERKKLWKIIMEALAKHNNAESLEVYSPIPFKVEAKAAIDAVEAVIDASYDAILHYHDKFYLECRRCIEAEASNHALDLIKKELKDLL